ncbi:MAG: polysaccharide biosynthesis/export family protein [Hyphomicrobiaceae bacterium]
MASAIPGATLQDWSARRAGHFGVQGAPRSYSKSVQVANSGTINLPLVGDIVAAGRTARDIERDLSAKLGAKYLRNPQVTVFVKEYNSQRITVEGAVNKPDVFRPAARQRTAGDRNGRGTGAILRHECGRVPDHQQQARRRQVRHCGYSQGHSH